MRRNTCGLDFVEILVYGIFVCINFFVFVYSIDHFCGFFFTLPKEFLLYCIIFHGNSVFLVAMAMITGSGKAGVL